MTHKPTDEQQEAIDMFATGEDLVIQAGAGTGKTATLLMMANRTCNRGQYVAFNKAIVTEAERKFPKHVATNTAHSLAFRAIGKQYQHRLNSSRMRSPQIADYLGIDDDFEVVVNDSSKPLARGWMAGLVMRAVTNFCQSADMEPSLTHFPYIPGIDTPENDGKRTYTNNNYLRRHLLEYFAKAWEDLMDPNGELPYKHEHYLKAWHLSGPKIPADYILFDEAQDANPVLLACVLAQNNAQKIMVGDSNQQIYEFTGAIDALTKTGIEKSVFLTQSFRFGEAIAEQANRVLQVLDSPLRLRGLSSIDSQVGMLYRPNCYLTRTNATAVRIMLEEMDAGRRPHLMGGGMDVKLFAEGARELMNGRATQHPDLACFANWSQVEEYVAQDVQGDDLRLLVKLCNDFSPSVIINMLERMPKEDRADVLISTAHKAKGREWHSVKLGSDFPAPKEGETTDPAELRLLYVAVTRASHILDPYSCPMLMGLNLSASIQQLTSQPTNGVDKTQLTVEAPKAPVVEPRAREAVDISTFVQGALFPL